MATIKPRLQISLSRTEDEILSSLAKRDQVPRATKAAQLVREAMELDEDFYLSRLAEERDVPGAKWIPHDEFWGKAFKKVKKA